MPTKNMGDPKDHIEGADDPPGGTQETGARPAHEMKRKEYEKEIEILHGELVALQEWVKADW